MAKSHLVIETSIVNDRCLIGFSSALAVATEFDGTVGVACLSSPGRLQEGRLVCWHVSC